MFAPLFGERLELRRLEPGDAPRIQRLAGDWEVAKHDLTRGRFAKRRNG